MKIKPYLETSHLLEQYGKELIDGSINDWKLKNLLTSFQTSSAPREPSSSIPSEPSQQERIDNFVLSICPQMTYEVLHQLTARLISLAGQDRDDNPLDPSPALESAFFAYESLDYPDKARLHFSDTETWKKHLNDDKGSIYEQIVLDPLKKRYQMALTTGEMTERVGDEEEKKSEFPPDEQATAEYDDRDKEYILALKKAYTVLENNLIKNADLKNIDSIFHLLGVVKDEFKQKDNLDESYINGLQQKLDSLGRLLIHKRASGISKLKAHSIGSDSPREALKRLLKSTKNFNELDPMIDAYLVAAANVIAHRVGYHNARTEALKIKEIQEVHPDCKIEIIRLKRHEVSTNKHKKYGFGSDTGLNAVDKRLFNRSSTVQSKFDLDNAKNVQSYHLKYLRAIGMVDKVEMFMSPVTRAWQTATQATLDDALIPDVYKTIDSRLSERPNVFLSKGFGRSGAPSRLPSELAKELNIPAENIDQDGDILLSGENAAEYKNRLEAAYALITTKRTRNLDEENQHELITEREVVAHGALNRDLISYFKQKGLTNGFECIDFPEGIPDHLAFGSRYNLIIVKNKNDEITKVIYNDISTRFGKSQEPHSKPQLSDVLNNLEQGIALLKGNNKAKYLFDYCELQPNEEKVKSYLREHAAFMLDHFDKFKPKPKNETEFNRAKLVVETLMDEELKLLDKQVVASRETQNKSFLIRAGSNVLKQATKIIRGKTPENQQAFVEGLQVLFNSPFTSPWDLKKQLDFAQEHFSTGKVINLVNAMIKLDGAKTLLAMPADERPRAESISGVLVSRNSQSISGSDDGSDEQPDEEQEVGRGMPGKSP